MNGNEYLKSLGGIDNEFIESAAAMEASRRRHSYGWIAAAAAAAVMVIGGALLLGGLKPKGEKTAVLPPETEQNETAVPITPAVDPTSVPTAAKDPFLPAEVRDQSGSIDASIINEGIVIGNYFILNGRVYQPYMQFLPYVQPEVFALIGPKVADVTVHYGHDESGIIDEGSGTAFTTDSISGEYATAVYELRGCDPESVLCLLHDGELRVYFSGAGTVTGADLFEGGFNLRERMSALLYEAYIRGNEEFDEKTRSLDPQYYPQISRFLDAIDSAEWVEYPHRGTDGPISAVFQLHFVLDDGMRVELLLYSDGRVLFRDYFTFAMLRPDSEAVNALIEVLLRHEGELTVLPEEDLEGQVDYLRGLDGFGACMPAKTPEGYEIDWVGAHPLVDGTGKPVGYSDIMINYRLRDNGSYANLDYCVYERSAYEASPWYAQYDDLSVNRLEPIPIEEFTREKILDCVLHKEGEDHSIYAAVDMGGYVVIVYCNYIIDDEIGSRQELDTVIDTVYEIIVTAGQ